MGGSPHIIKLDICTHTTHTLSAVGIVLLFTSSWSTTLLLLSLAFSDHGGANGKVRLAALSEFDVPRFDLNVNPYWSLHKVVDCCNRNNNYNVIS